MTSPGGEHISRYRALGEFDNLIREANKAKRALRELREEEAKLNAQSIADDKKIAASKAERTKAEQQSAEASKKAVTELNKTNVAGKAGEDAGTAYSRGMGRGIERGTQSAENRRFVEAATKALQGAFAKAGNESGVSYTRGLSKGIDQETKNGVSPDFAANAVKALKAALGKAGDESGNQFLVSVRERFKRDANNILQTSGFEYSLREFATRAGRSGEDTGNSYITGFATKLKSLNNILPLLGQDKLDLDVDITDARQSMAALEFELKRLSHTTAEPRVRIDSTRALENLRAIQKLFKDEVAEDIIKETKRIQEELKVVDTLPSGKAFKFWALTALSDMSRVFEEAERGTSVFEKLRRAATAGGGGGGGNFLHSFVEGFDDFSEASSKLLQRLSRISGELYRMPGVIGVLVSAIPALIAGLGSLGGAALGAVSALGSLTGLFAAAPGVMFAFAGAIGAVKDSFGGLADILKNARQARQEQAEAEEKARLGTEKALTATQKFNLAMKDLDPSTQKVTNAFIDFSEAYAESQKKVGENFFKEIADQTERLNKVLPITENFFGKSATAVGKLADQGIRMITSGPWKRDFATIADTNVKVINDLGKAGFSLANVFRNITIAATPFTTWITGALKEGAKNFADWSAQARSDGTIQDFLNETTESARILWQIIKNLGSTINSFFQSSVDAGQDYLRMLEDVTEHWAEVAEAQEKADSPLRKWLQDIKPVLSAMGDLIKAVAVGLANMASDQRNLASIIELLKVLQTQVLPPILEILQHLNDSGITVTVAKALGDMLQAISTFLDSGATTALTVFVTVLANFFELLFNIASLPGVSTVLGAVASALAALAAVSIVARFTGLFKLWDFFTWMIRNKGNLSGAFADAARSAAGLNTVGTGQALPRNIPTSIGGVGSEVLEQQARATDRVGNASVNSARKVGIFNRALSDVTISGGAARGALSGLAGFLGGPWGVALIAATTLIGVVSSKLSSQKQEVEDTKNAFLALKNAFGELSEGNTDNVNQLAATDEKFRDITSRARELGLTLTDVSGALNNNDQSLNRVNSQLDTQIAAYERLRIAAFEAGGPSAALPFKKLKDEAIDFKNSINEVAGAQEKSNEITNNAIGIARTYQERLGGMSQAQVDNAVEVGALDNQIRLLSGALDTLSSSTATYADRGRALGDIINYQTNSTVAAIEADEAFNSSLLNLTETVEANRDSVGKHGNALAINTQAGLRNRDALQAAAKATRELFLQDIASGEPMDKALERHQDRIKALTEEARRLGLNKTETEKLIKAYGDVPENIETEIKTDEKGFAQVYADLLKLQIIQNALKEGKSIEQANKEWNSKSGSLYRPYSPTRPDGDGYGVQGYATGGPVWGAGTRTSDSIMAWLSNGEYVQPTDAVEHYGMPVMEALRTRKLDKSVIEEALPDSNSATYARGGSVHSDNCASCSLGGHRFATGGSVRVPVVVDPSKTMVDKDWAYAYAGNLGMQTGTGGVAWMMRALRQQFPGLPLISGFRPGARTLSGNRSYHALNRAVDLPPRRDVAQWIRANYGANTKELITPFNDLNLHNGKPHRYTGAVWNQHNFAGGNAHDHWAYRDGGLVDIMNMLGMNNLSTPRNAPLPTTPRTLSPAASSVVNNTNDTSRTFGDVIINNPVPERASESIRDTIYRTNLLF